MNEIEKIREGLQRLIDAGYTKEQIEEFIKNDKIEKENKSND